MTNAYSPSKGIYIYDRADFNVTPLAQSRIDDLMSSDEEALLLEPVTLDDIEHAYLSEHLTAEGDTAMFEAVSTNRMRLGQTMRAFVRVLNRGLNGTGIIAGTHDAGTDETGLAVVGGASIGNVRKVAGIPVMTAKIPLTDGQSVSLIFHSPTASGSKLVSSDALVAFKFLLNARDVTHVVAPVGGRDISLDQTAQSLSNLIERNSAKFKKQQQGHKNLRASAESAEEEANKLESQAADAMASADAVLTQKATLTSQFENVNSALERIKQENSQLKQAIEELKRQKTEKQAKQAQSSSTPPAAVNPLPQADLAHQTDTAITKVGSEDRESLKAFVGASANITDAYDFYRWFYRTMGSANDVNPLKRPGEGALSMDEWMSRLKAAFSDVPPVGDVENDQPAQQAWFEAIYLAMFPQQPEPLSQAGKSTEGDKGLFYYGMKARPAWKPRGAIEEFSPEQASKLEIVKRKEVHPNDYRWGVVAYAQPLSANKVSDYELVDFQALQSSSEALAIWDELNPLIADFKRDNPDGTEKNFLSQYLKFNAPDADKLPQAVKDAGGAIPLLRVIGQAKKQTTLQTLAEMFSRVTATAVPGVDEQLQEELKPQEEPPKVEEPQLNEADQAADAGIGYLNELLSFESSDPTLIDAEMAKVQDIAASLSAAAKMDENEDLLNRVVDHLVGLSVKIAQGGAS